LSRNRNPAWEGLRDVDRDSYGVALLCADTERSTKGISGVVGVPKQRMMALWWLAGRPHLAYGAEEGCSECSPALYPAIVLLVEIRYAPPRALGIDWLFVSSYVQADMERGAPPSLNGTQDRRASSGSDGRHEAERRSDSTPVKHNDRCG